jgi:hypothetical protein
MPRSAKMSGQAAGGGTRIGWRALATLLVMPPLVGLSQFLRSSIGVIAPDLMHELDLSADDVGRLLTVGGTLAFASAPRLAPLLAERTLFADGRRAAAGSQ